MLKLEHITWSTPDGVKILDDVNLEVPDKKLIAITGPNGGGKTTLAKVMAGILTPDSGRVLLDGQDITKLDVTQRAHKGIAFAFQQPVRFKGLTVRTLIEIAAGGEVSYTSLCDHMAAVGLCASRSPQCWPGRRVCPYSTSRKPASTSGASPASSRLSTPFARGRKVRW